jgi:hypothetical protein
VPENNNRNNKKGGGSGILGLVVLGLFVLSSRLDNDQFPISFILLVGVFVAFIVYAVVVASKKNKAQKGTGSSAAPARTASPAAARPTPVRPAPAGTPRGAEKAEEAVHCHHSTGREKYLEQLDSFLANGIIDKAEYKTMKERYSKLDVEDDYH